MSLDKILSISGKPGLYELKARTRAGFVAESLVDGKKMAVGAHNNVSMLSEIAIYTYSEEVPLREVFQKIAEKEDAKETIEEINFILVIIDQKPKVLFGFYTLKFYYY